MKKKVVFLVSLVLFVLPFFLSPPFDLSEEGFKTLVIFAICTLWWITNVVPIMITSLFAIISFPLLGLASSEEVYSYFGNTSVFFLIGSFIISSVLRRNGITQKVALKFIETFGKNPKRLILSVLFSSYFLSLWMLSHAVVAVLLPIVLEIASNMEEGSEKFAKALLLGTFWGAVLGGNTTLLGGARAPLVFAMFQPYFARRLTFLKWILASLPITGTLLLFSSFFLIKLTPNLEMEKIRKFLRSSMKEDTLSSKKIFIIAVTIVTIFLWMFAGERIGVANIALGAVIVLFFMDAVSWGEVEEDVNWGVILMYGGAIVLGRMVSKTGLAEWIVSHLKMEVLSPTVLFFTMIIGGMLLTEVMSNSAAAVVLTQFAIPLLGSMKIPPEAVAVMVSMVTGFSFMFPTGSPSAALIASTGYIQIKDLVKYGAFIAFLSFVVFVVFVNTLWKWIF
ncbi:DASS family sodium-coupled anion symporter [Thermotoga sp. KOL6]|uniref:SLC13 family permease n=1 Tax=Thermotoga sp. KOL6 TaxID=126741 RepID=UPI000C75FD51|nr:DASS family sodium-coupled anion symporter [Thermotoga sp. KOL6]PLV59327.1 hypothetical protein AS005_06195 [Thermotoga sp. KOL6]